MKYTSKKYFKFKNLKIISNSKNAFELYIKYFFFKIREKLIYYGI